MNDLAWWHVMAILVSAAASGAIAYDWGKLVGMREVRHIYEESVREHEELMRKILELLDAKEDGR